MDSDHFLVPILRLFPTILKITPSSINLFDCNTRNNCQGFSFYGLDSSGQNEPNSEKRMLSNGF
jgi:hypothetical protein